MFHKFYIYAVILLFFLIIYLIKKLFIKSTLLKIISDYTIISMVIIVVFYDLLPIFLNYAPGVMEGNYITKWTNNSYLQQYLVISSLAFFIGIISILWFLRGINKWNESLLDDIDKINKLRERCIYAPRKIYLLQVISPTIFLFIYHSQLDVPVVVTIKTILIILVFTTSIAIGTFLSTKTHLKVFLVKTYIGQETNFSRLGLTGRIFGQIIPMFIVVITYTSLIGYTLYFNERGNYLYSNYKSQLEYIFKDETIKNIEQIKEKLSNIKLVSKKDVSFFIVPPNGTITPLDGQIYPEYFIKYWRDITPSTDGRIYQFLDERNQGVEIKVNGFDGNWKVGIKYNILYDNVYYIFFVNFGILLLAMAWVLGIFSKSIAKEIDTIAKELDSMGNSESSLDEPLKLTSKDEIGKLVISFNKVQDLQKSHRAKEKLLSLAELAGGLAHDIANPITSTSGLLSCIGISIQNYENQMQNGNCDHDAFLKTTTEIKEIIEEANEELYYASTIVEDVREYIQLGRHQESSNFYVQDIIKHIEGRNLKHDCKVNIENHVAPSITINGPLSVLERSIRNVLKNASEAYESDEDRIVDVIITLSENTKNIVIEFRDYTKKGLSEEAEKKLCKEMVTSKGKNGTGLGIFLTNAAINSRFNGTITFKRQDKGTSFYIIIPVSNSN